MRTEVWGGEVGMSVCIVGRCEPASDGVLKEVLKDAPTAERWRGAARVPVQKLDLCEPGLVANANGMR